jgi:hypothetical protein
VRTDVVVWVGEFVETGVLVKGPVPKNSVGLSVAIVGGVETGLSVLGAKPPVGMSVGK